MKSRDIAIYRREQKLSQSKIPILNYSKERLASGKTNLLGKQNLRLEDLKHEHEDSLKLEK